MKKALIYIGLTIALIVVGFLTGQRFMNISISELNLNGISLVWKSLSGQFNQNLIFSIAIGLIPLLHFISSKFAKVNSIQSRIIVFVTIISSCIIFWQFRIIQLNRLFEKYNEFNTDKGIKNSYFSEDLNFGLFLMLGFFIGAIIITMTYKQLNKRK